MMWRWNLCVRLCRNSSGHRASIVMYHLYPSMCTLWRSCSKEGGTLGRGGYSQIGGVHSPASEKGVQQQIKGVDGSHLAVWKHIRPICIYIMASCLLRTECAIQLAVARVPSLLSAAPTTLAATDTAQARHLVLSRSAQAKASPQKAVKRGPRVRNA